MKLISKASLSFKLGKPTTKPSFGANVITALSASIQFPDLPVTIAELTTVNNALSAAIAAARTGNHTAVAAVKTAVTTWDNDFTLTANYVTPLRKAMKLLFAVQVLYLPKVNRSQRRSRVHQQVLLLLLMAVKVLLLPPQKMQYQTRPD